MYIHCIYVYIHIMDIKVNVYTLYVHDMYLYVQVRRTRAYLDSLSMDGAEVAVNCLCSLVCNVLVPGQ
jgi:hypothetical protein